MATAPVADQLRLLDLQALDTTLARRAHEQRTLPARDALRELKGRDQDLHNALVEASSAAGDARRALSKAEAAVDQVRTRLERDRARLDSGEGLSRELVSLQEEIARLEARQAVLEDEQIEAMEASEAADERVAALKAQREAIGTDRAAHLEDLDREETRLDQEISDLTKQREALAGSLDAGLIAEYESARKRTGGLGAVGMRGHRAEGIATELTVAEYSQIDGAAEDDVVVLEDRGWIIVRIPEDA